MIKNWQSHKKYLHFLKHCKARMDSSQRIRWKELRPIRKRLKSLNLDAAGVFLFPLYSFTGRPALNQPQILRSFILWFLLFRQGLVKLSLTEWVEKLKGDELYSNLIGCSSGSSPPLGSYYDFIDRLWAGPHSDRYSRNKTFPSNKNRGRPASLPAELKIDTDGTPVCQAGRRMVFWGNCGTRYRTKWRCPVTVGRCDSCPCPCSDSPYGRVIYTKPGWDIRLYTPVPRGTALYRKIYRNRTCTERVNNRILNDYGLHSLVVHSARRYSFIIMVIGICIHLDARYKQKHPCLKGS